MSTSNKAINTIKNLLTFGIEIECGLDNRRKFDKYIKDHNIANLNFNEQLQRILNNVVQTYNEQDDDFIDEIDQNFRRWVIGRDGSLRFATQSVEIKSRVLKGDKGIKEVEKVFEVLNEAGFTTNETCGLHVHIGSKIFDKSMLKNLILLYSLLQKRMEKNIFTKERIANDYCKNLNLVLYEHFGTDNFADERDSKNIEGILIEYENNNERLIRVCADERYASLSYSNIKNPNRHDRPLGTIEFRQLQGTIDFNLFLFWMNFIYNLVYYSQKKQFEKILEILKSDDLSSISKIDAVFSKIANKSIEREISKETVFKNEFVKLVEEISKNKKANSREAAERFFKKHAKSFIQ